MTKPDRRSTAASGYPGEGPRRDALRGRPADRGLLHARLVLAPHAHARIVSIDARRPWRCPGVVAVLTAADLPIKGEGMGSPQQAARAVGGRVRRRARRAGVADVRGRGRTAPSSWRSRLEPLPVVVDAEGAMDPASPLAWQESREGSDGLDGRPDPRRRRRGRATSRSRPRSCRQTWPGGAATGMATSRARSAGAAVVREGRFTTSWIHQGYLEPQACTAWIDADGDARRRDLDPGLFETPQRGRQGARAPAAPGAGRRDAARRGVRREVAVVRHARRRRGLEAPPPRPARRSTRAEDFAATNPGQPFVTDAPDRRGRRGPVHRPRGRIVADAGAFEEGTRRVARGRARRGAVCLARVRRQGLRRADESVRRRARIAARARRRRRWRSRRSSTRSRPSSASTRSRSGAATSPRLARRWSTARLAGNGAEQVLDAMAASPVWQGRAQCRRRRGRRCSRSLLARGDERRRRRVPDVSRRQRPGAHRRRRHVGRGGRVPGDRRRDPGHRAGPRRDRGWTRARRRCRPAAAARR